jgi:hypothetical protein
VVNLNSAGPLAARPAIGRLGWLPGDGFAPYADVSFDGMGEFRGIYEAVREKGSREAWTALVSPLRQSSLEVRLMMDAALASPILTKLGIAPFVLCSGGRRARAKPSPAWSP